MPPTRFIRKRKTAMQVDLTSNIIFCCKLEEIPSYSMTTDYLWLHDLHDDREENSEPSLRQEIVEDQTAWQWCEVS